MRNKWRHLIIILSCVTLVSLVAVRIYRPEHERQRGRRTATADWRAQEAVIIRCSLEDELVVDGKGYTVTRLYDPKTGLRFRADSLPGRHSEDYVSAYNSRVRELVTETGIPEWSRSRRWLVSNKEFISLLTSPQFEEVPELPYKVAPSLTLTHRRPSGGISVSTPIGRFGGGFETSRVFIGRLKRVPNVRFVRIDDYMVFAVHDDGDLIGVVVGTAKGDNGKR